MNSSASKLIFILYLSANGIVSASEQTNSHEIASGNTLVITNKFGTTLIQFKPDGSFLQFSESGNQSSGKWRAINTDLCTTVLPQPNTKNPKEHCISLKSVKIGSSWKSNIHRQNGLMIYQIISGHPTFHDIKTKPHEAPQNQQ